MVEHLPTMKEMVGSVSTGRASFVLSIHVDPCGTSNTYLITGSIF